MLGLDIAYSCTKFDDCNSIRSRDMVGAHQTLNESRDLTTPLSGMICYPWATLATISLTTELEVSISTHHVDMIGDTKCRKCGGLE